MIMFWGTEPTGNVLFFVQLTRITWVVSSFRLLLCKEKQLGCRTERLVNISDLLIVLSFVKTEVKFVCAGVNGTASSGLLQN